MYIFKYICMFLHIFRIVNIQKFSTLLVPTQSSGFCQVNSPKLVGSVNEYTLRSWAFNPVSRCFSLQSKLRERVVPGKPIKEWMQIGSSYISLVDAPVTTPEIPGLGHCPGNTRRETWFFCAPEWASAHSRMRIIIFKASFSADFRCAVSRKAYLIWPILG